MRRLIAILCALPLLLGSAASHNTPLSVRMPNHGEVTSVQSLEDFMKYRHSSGPLTGFDITKSESTNEIIVASGEAILRETDSPTAPFHIVAVPGATLEVPAESTSYLIVDYNGGSPQLSIVLNITAIPCQAKCAIAVINQEHDEIHVLPLEDYANDFEARTARRLAATRWINHGSGVKVTDAGTRQFAVSAGAFYILNLRKNIAAMDTSATDTFTTAYRKAGGGFVYTDSVATIPNTHYDDGSGTLAALLPNKFVNFWVFMIVNEPNHLLVIYPQNDHPTLVAAQAEQDIPGTRPAATLDYGTATPIARITVGSSQTEIQAIAQPFAPAIVWE